MADPEPNEPEYDGDGADVDVVSAHLLPLVSDEDPPPGVDLPRRGVWLLIVDEVNVHKGLFEDSEHQKDELDADAGDQSAVKKRVQSV